MLIGRRYLAILIVLVLLISIFIYVYFHSEQKIDSWAIQLQGADPQLIAKSGFDLVVIDYSRDGAESTKYSADEISVMKNAGIIPIAYISIGEAEDYRFYWNDSWYDNPPEWLGREDLDWPGNYPVKYWYNEWKSIVFKYIDKIIEQGFEGLYLDRVDVFEYWSDPNNGENFTLSEETAARLMINFVIEIANYCRVTRGLKNFIIIPQNGERILMFDDGRYLDTISGIAIEDLWYMRKDPLPLNITEQRIYFIDKVARKGKIVLSVDYVDDGTGYSGENMNRIRDYIMKARSKGYIPYAAHSDRALDELVIIPGLQPKN